MIYFNRRFVIVELTQTLSFTENGISTQINQIKVSKSIKHLQNCIFHMQSVIQPSSITSLFSLPSPPVRESPTNEKPFLIRHTFEKCQKCFKRLVWAQLVQSDVHTGLIKAVSRELRVQRGGAACHGATIWFSRWTFLWPVCAGLMCGQWGSAQYSVSEKSEDRTTWNPATQKYNRIVFYYR